MRVLVLTFFHGLGHVVRCTRIAEELHRSGHEVLVATAAAAAHIPRARGLPTREIWELPPIGAGTPPPPAGARLRLADPVYLGRCLDEERGLIREFQPDVVLVDFRVTGAISARLEGVHSAWIVNTSFFSHPLPEVLADVVPELRSLGIPGDVAERILGDVVYNPDWGSLDPLSSITNEASRHALWSVDEIRHVGPILKTSASALPNQAEARAILTMTPDRRVVFVSLGGTAQGYRSLQELAPLLGSADAETVLVTGPNIDPALLDTRGVSRVMPYTEDAMLWARAADLVVSHGGHTSTMEAVAVGTPILAIPGHAEQHRNATRAVDWGVGEILEPERLADDAVSTINRLVNDEDLHARARLLGSRLERFDGAAALVDHVEQTGALRLR